MPAGWTAAAIAGSGALSAGSSLLGAGKSAGAAKDAANLSNQRYQQTRGDLAPFTTAGQGGLDTLTGLAKLGPNAGGPDYVAQANALFPGQMTQAELEQTPGYQFTLGQGLKAVQSANAAKGLGVSGAALKGAAQFATGLANNTYKDQFNIAQQRFADVGTLNTMQQGNVTNAYNRASGLASLGENAAAQTGSTGATLANQAGNALMAAGNDQAAGLKGVSNALTDSVNNYLGYRSYTQNSPQAVANNATAAAQYGNKFYPQGTPGADA
jgi:hypothetical protein